MNRRALTMLAEQTFGRWAVGVGAVLLAISGIFGGWQRVEPEPSKPDTPIDGGAWTVTVTGARVVVGDFKPMVVSNKENHWLVVLATIEIKADRTWSGLTEIIQLPQTEGIENDKDGLTSARDVVLMRDATIIDRLHPGMPEKVAFFWEQKKGSAVPSELRVVVTAREFRTNSLTFGEEWMDNDEGDTLATVPVTDRREAGASPSPSAPPVSPRPSATPSAPVSPRPPASASPRASS